jgi:hypothetical protein
MGELARHEGIAAAQVEHLGCICVAVNRPDQLFDVSLGEGQQQVLIDEAVATEAAQHAHGGFIVDQLSIPRAKDDGYGSLEAHPSDVVKEL